jgi:hypothetical protein
MKLLDLLKKPFRFFRTLLYMAGRYDSDQTFIRETLLKRQREILHQISRMDTLEKLVRDRTDISVDIGFKDASYVVVTGRYRNRDYVETFQLGNKELSVLIEELKRMERYGTISHMDAPPQFRAVIDRELKTESEGKWY